MTIYRPRKKAVMNHRSPKQHKNGPQFSLPPNRDSMQAMMFARWGSAI
jgi:hypothetical protein